MKGAGLIFMLALCLVLPRPSLADEFPVRFKFDFLCDYESPDGIPKFQSDYCHASKEISTAQMTREMNLYWSNVPNFYPARTNFYIALRKKFAEAEAARKSLSKAQADSMNLAALCQRWRMYRNKAAIDSMAERHLLSPSEIALVRERKIAIGISIDALRCSWGKADEENRTVTESNIHIQHVYGSTYVYTENGRVTAFQD